MLLTDLPCEIIWIILECHLSDISKKYYVFDPSQSMYGQVHRAYKCFAWGHLIENYTCAHFQDNQIWLNDRTSFTTGVPPFLIVSLLRSICKKIKHCIDHNSYSTIYHKIPGLMFIKRDYVISNKRTKL